MSNAVRQPAKAAIGVFDRCSRLKPSEPSGQHDPRIQATIAPGGQPPRAEPAGQGGATILDRRRFLRVHRSAIVHLARIREVYRPASGEAIAVLLDGTQIKLSRARRKELERRLQE